MNAVQIARFCEMYRGLVALDPARLDLEVWRWGDDVGGQVTDRLLEGDCGTEACAVGWACSMPGLIEQGLKYDLASSGPKYGQLGHWDAVQAFFGLTEAEANALFQAAYGLYDREGNRLVYETDAQWMAQAVVDGYSVQVGFLETFARIRIDNVETTDHGRVLARMRAFAAWKGFDLNA